MKRRKNYPAPPTCEGCGRPKNFVASYHAGRCYGFGFACMSYRCPSKETN